MPKLILFNKPYGVLSQFTDSQSRRQTLANYVQIPGVYAAGRLDQDSEGLLLLTDSGPLQHRIASPRNKMPKTYWVQVEGSIDQTAMDALSGGIELKDGMTRPCLVKAIEPPDLWPRVPPVRERQSVPTSWIEMTITEGKNRQVRRMTAAAGFPTLRLVRYQIGEWTINGLAPGDFREQTIHLPTPPPSSDGRGKNRRGTAARSNRPKPARNTRNRQQ